MIGAADPLDQRCLLALDSGLVLRRTVAIRINSLMADQLVTITRSPGVIGAEYDAGICQKIDKGRRARR